MPSDSVRSSTHPQSLQHLLGAEHGGPAVGAVATGPQPPLQARRVEDMPAPQLCEPVTVAVAVAAAPLQAYGALRWSCFATTAVASSFLCSSSAAHRAFKLRDDDDGLAFGEQHRDGRTLIRINGDGLRSRTFFFNLAGCDGVTITRLEAVS